MSFRQRTCAQKNRKLIDYFWGRGKVKVDPTRASEGEGAEDG